MRTLLCFSEAHKAPQKELWISFLLQIKTFFPSEEMGTNQRPYLDF